MTKKEISLPRVIVSATLKLGSFFVLFFVGAGRLDYWQGWGFTILLLGTSITAFILFRKNKALFEERLKPGPGMKWWDRIFWFFNIFLFMGILVVGILDGGRFMWTTNIPTWVYILSYIGYILGCIILFWSMWTNQFFSTVVRIQKDRGQKVITSGPYKIVRHPGYFGAIFVMLSCGPILGSYWAMIGGGLWVLAIIIRTYMEDKTLQKELEGYKEYTKKTRFRLIPGFWAFLLTLTILGGCGASNNQITWDKYEGQWFDVEFPSNFTAIELNEKDAAMFVNENEDCIFYVYSPQWAGKSEMEEKYEAEELVSEVTEGNKTTSIYKNEDTDLIREIEVTEENNATVRYVFLYGHSINKDNCRPEYEKFKASLKQYAD